VVRPARYRGHGPARLDWPMKRATVADKVMKSGKMVTRQRPVLGVNARKRSAQARIKESGRRRQPSKARERWKPAGARLAQARLDTRQRDRPCMAGDAQIQRLKDDLFMMPKKTAVIVNEEFWRDLYRVLPINDGHSQALFAAILHPAAPSDNSPP